MLDTWARRPRVKIEIFATYNNSASHGHGNGLTLENGINIIPLPNVPDTSYPSQKKSFFMLKYIYENHPDKYV